MCADESLRNISVEAADRVPADAACLLNAGLCGPLALAALEMTSPLFCLTSCCSVHTVPDRSLDTKLEQVYLYYTSDIVLFIV